MDIPASGKCVSYHSLRKVLPPLYPRQPLKQSGSGICLCLRNARKELNGSRTDRNADSAARVDHRKARYANVAHHYGVAVWRVDISVLDKVRPARVRVSELLRLDKSEALAVVAIVYYKASGKLSSSPTRPANCCLVRKLHIILLKVKCPLGSLAGIIGSAVERKFASLRNKCRQTAISFTSYTLYDRPPPPWTSFFSMTLIQNPFPT